jgi:hypothetical protein
VDEEPVPTTEVFLDEDRGSLLRVRWSEQEQLLHVSIWREDGTCAATHRLGGNDPGRLSALLTQAWVDALRHAHR